MRVDRSLVVEILTGGRRWRGLGSRRRCLSDCSRTISAMAYAHGWWCARHADAPFELNIWRSRLRPHKPGGRAAESIRSEHPLSECKHRREEPSGPRAARAGRTTNVDDCIAERFQITARERRAGDSKPRRLPFRYRMAFGAAPGCAEPFSPSHRSSAVSVTLARDFERFEHKTSNSISVTLRHRPLTRCALRSGNRDIYRRAVVR